MTFLHSELANLIQRHLDGQLTDDEMDRLNTQLRNNAAARDWYLQLADVHSCLSVDEQLWVVAPSVPGATAGAQRRGFGRAVRSVALAMLGLVCLMAVGPPEPPA